MTIKFCIETNKGEYIPIEFTQGKEDEFFEKLFNEYGVRTFIPEDNMDLLGDAYDFSTSYDGRCEDGFCYKNHNKVIEDEVHNEDFILYNNKIFIEQLYHLHLIDIQYRLIFCVKPDCLNEIDRKNTGIILDGKFINIDRFYNKYKAMEGIVKISNSRYETIWRSKDSRAHICMVGDDCIEFMLDIDMGNQLNLMR